MDAASVIITSFQTIPIGAHELKWIKINHCLEDQLSSMNIDRLYKSSLCRSTSTSMQTKSTFRELGGYSLCHKNKILGWAHLQLHHTKFDRLFIYISGKLAPDHEIALDYLISGCFLTFKPDEIRVISSSSFKSLASSESRLVSLNTHKLKSFKLKESYIDTYISYEFSMENWKKSKLFNQCYEELRHLEQRRLRLIREQTCCQGKAHKKRSLLARLFRPTIDDPLF